MGLTWKFCAQNLLERREYFLFEKHWLRKEGHLSVAKFKQYTYRERPRNNLFTELKSIEDNTYRYKHSLPFGDV